MAHEAESFILMLMKNILERCESYKIFFFISKETIK